jgi:UDP-GlcNAc:undecaprenyl-phosphate GlcNAc-1-phosphate transferase
MLSISLAFVVALIVTAGLTPIVRHFALAAGAVDEPTARRVHSKRVPRLGGVAIVLGFSAPLLALYILKTDVGRTIAFRSPKLLAGLFAGAVIMAILGFVDDVVGVGAKRKLFVQVIAASIAFACGLRIDSFALPMIGELSLGWLAFPATVLWIATVANALNLIDGLDGLAAGVAFFGCVTNFVVALMSHNLMICLFSASLAGAILGFLIYNFNPATIFMGDSGSLFLGYILATMSLLGSSSQKSPTAIAILVPLIALGLPLMDMLLAMARRILERRSIFSADRGHLHHRLLDLGLTHRRAVLVLYGLSLLFTAIALVVYLGRSWQIGISLITLTLTLVGVVRFTRYFTVALARREARSKDPLTQALRQAVPTTLVKLSAARTMDEVNTLLEQLGEQVGLLAIELTPAEGSSLQPWRWEAKMVVRASAQEASMAQFSIVDDAAKTCEISVYHDCAQGYIPLQAEILLQLIVDAVQAVVTRKERARHVSRAGHLRPV